MKHHHEPPADVLQILRGGVPKPANPCDYCDIRPAAHTHPHEYTVTRLCNECEDSLWKLYNHVLGAEG